MRITLGMSTDQTLLNLNDQQVQIDSLSQEISSGKKLASPSDDPLSWSQTMNTSQTLREYNSFVGNINFATEWGNSTQSALNQFADLLTQAKSIAEQGVSAVGMGQSGPLISEIGVVVQQALSNANTQFNGQYIFAGTATGAPPYSLDSSTGAVTYSGNSDYIKVKTGMGLSSAITPSSSSVSGGGMTSVNVTGPDVLGGSTSGGGSNMLNDIWNLQNALKTGDVSGISNSITTLGNDYNQINNQLTTVGTTLSGLTGQQSALQTMVTNETGVQSNYQDADVASATVKLSTAQTAFEAALQVTSTLDNLNLATILH